ncbi:MAG: phosphotransferase, partial [Acidimicrobiia bacterium]
LHGVPTTGAPPATNRARPLADYDVATRWAIDRASHLIDATAAIEVWEEALAAAPHDGAPVWVQGDLEGNCLVRDGQLCGIVDWGSACAGDPAVDERLPRSEHTRWTRLCAKDEPGESGGPKVPGSNPGSPTIKGAGQEAGSVWHGVAGPRR